MLSADPDEETLTGAGRCTSECNRGYPIFYAWCAKSISGTSSWAKFHFATLQSLADPVAILAVTAPTREWWRFVTVPISRIARPIVIGATSRDSGVFETRPLSLPKSSRGDGSDCITHSGYADAYWMHDIGISLGAEKRVQSNLSLGARTIASPTRTLRLSTMQRQSSLTRRFAWSIPTTATSAVTMSPGRTGARNFSV